MDRQECPKEPQEGRRSRRAHGGAEPLRRGFSTGTAVTAAARAALRGLLCGDEPKVIAVRLPAGFFLPVPIASLGGFGDQAVATVIKDAGDDPDVTHKAEIRVRLRLFAEPSSRNATAPPRSFEKICLIGGEGVGTVTKPGLPVAVGEPAVNPVPREMLLANLIEEWSRCTAVTTGRNPCNALNSWTVPDRPHVWLGSGTSAACSRGPFVEVEITVPKGEELARHTLNPRLGILGGISILGTTGIVKPFSHKAYEETIQAALTVARCNGCDHVVLSTGGKSENFARALLKGLPAEAFVQVADFFAFSVREARKMGFGAIVHSVFFGKAVKMAQGHAYTHAHEVPMDLHPLAQLARDAGWDEDLSDELANANTAQHALSILLEHDGGALIQAIARQALAQSARIAEGAMKIRLMLFDQKGSLLADVQTE